jgi:phage tail-like protein
MNPYLLLDDITDWRCSFSGITASSSGLRLDAIPGPAEPFFPDAQKDLECPDLLIAPPCRPLHLLDQKTNRILTMDPGNGEIAQIPGVGGIGHRVRQFRNPEGLAVLTDGSIAIADTGNHRVQVFSPDSYTLLAVIPSRTAGISSSPHDHLYVSDSAEHCIAIFQRDGTPIKTFGADQLQQPSALALSGNTLAVMDRATGAIVLFQRNEFFQQIEDIDKPRALTFSPDGNLYIGTSAGLLFAYARKTDKYERLGVGVLGIDGGITALAYSGTSLLAIVHPDTATNPRVWKINLSGAAALSGTATSITIDSGIENCQWHRMMLMGSTPSGTTIEVRAQSSIDPEQHWSVESHKPALLSGDAADPDCLFQCPPGRYLRFHLTFRSEGTTTPSVTGIRLYFPRSSYLQYLPAVYQEDPESRFFLERFLSIFQTSFDRFDAVVDNLWRMFDPSSVPEAYLPWLAAWLAFPFDPEWPVAKKRTVLKRAFQDYKLRGTKAGLEQLIADYSPVPWGRIVEHYTLRTWLRTCCGVLDSGVRLWSRDFYQRLQLDTYSRLGYFRLTNTPEPVAEPFTWGAHRFSVFFPVNPYDTGQTAAKVIQVVESEKPAHTQAVYCPVYPRFRVGVQSTIEVDTVVADINHLVLGSLATLGYDSILAGSPAARATNQIDRSRTGVNSTLS